jgi:adenylate cyclase
MFDIQGDKKIWSLRMGIHTGPVTAVLSGGKKVFYDLKGETVNITSRLQATTEAGKLVVSAMTYELVKDYFLTEYYAKMPVKYLGQLGMYEVMGIRNDMTEDGFAPNKKYMVRYCLRQFTDLQEIILDKLEKELPSYLYYHNVKHTVDVVTEVELIGLAEGVNEEELMLLKTAGLFHDVGHVKGYDGHEFFGTEIVREFLPNYHYSNEQIEKICEIIMATKIPPKPKNLLEEIICDSDLDYLGRNDFIPVSNDLYRELKEQNKIGTLNDWNKMQVKFISNHKYFTKTARLLREVNKTIQIERLAKLITPD